MEKDDALIIERVGNGYIVRPVSAHGEMSARPEILVFQKMGSSYSGDDTLLGFVEGHFSEGKFGND